MYIGLLNFSILIVFGISGLLAVLQPPPEARAHAAPVVETRDYHVPANLSDADAALAAYQYLKLPIVAPPPKFVIHRDAANNLAFEVWSVDGPRTVTLLERENRVRIESHRNSVWQFIDNLHTTTVNARVPDLRVRLWTWYNEFAIWSLIFMACTGVWLWLASRPKYLWAGISFAAGSAAFILLYALSR